MNSPRETLLSPPSPSIPSLSSRLWILLREAVPYLLAFTLVAATVVGFLRWHNSSDYKEEILFWQARLSGVADDHAQRVSDWIGERQGDARDSSTRPSIRAVLRVWGQQGQLPKIPSASQDEWLSALDDMATSYSYAGVYILDLNAHVVMQSRRSIPLKPLLVEGCRAVARSGEARTELTGDTPMQTLAGFIAPVFAGRAAGDPGQTPGKILGTVLLVSDASQTLFPLVTREAVPTRTGESILVRREGNEIIYFSPMRHIPPGSRSLRFSLSAAPAPARLALKGQQTFVESNDYRGVPVLAVTEHIPRTSWGLVRKIDRSEALEDFRRMAMLESLAGGFLIVLLGGLLLFHRHYTITRVRKREEEKFRALLESAPDAIYLIEPSTLRILGRNRRAAEMDGYSDEEITRMTATNLHPPEDHAALRERVAPGSVSSGVLPIQTVYHRRKNGQLVPVEENQTLVNAGGESLVLSIVRDITERQRAEVALRESEEHFRSLFENMLNGFAFCQMHFDHDKPQDFTYLEVNPALETLTGLKDVKGKKVSEVIPGLRESDPDVFEMYGRVALTGRPERMETFVDALGMWFSIAAYSPKKEYFVAVFDVITERKRAEMELRRVNRALRTISVCNQVLVRAAEELYLLEDICGILVRDGGYRMAWVGLAEHDEGKSVRPAAHAGFEEGYLQQAGVTWADTERGRGPTGTAIRTGKPVVVRTIETEPSLALWREDQLKRGYASSTALPIRLNNYVAGALTVYAEEPDAFDSAEVQLLAELADDVAYGIQTLRTKAERKVVEQALVAERQLLHTLMDNLPDWIYFKDRRSRFTQINLALAEKFGLDHPAQAVGKSDLDFMAAGHAGGFHNDDADVLRTGQPIVGKEESGVWPDGHVTWISTTKMPVRDPNGNIIGTFGVSRDITERKRVEEALRESEEKYRSLVSNIPDVTWTLDVHQHFVFISKNIERLTGFSHDEVYEHGADLYLSSLHPDDVHKVREALRALFAEGRPYDVECRVKHKNGDWIWVHDRALATYEKDGIRYADGLLSDITERKRIEETLRLTQFSVEHASDGTFWMDAQGHIVYANEAACRSLGCARKELLSLSIPDIDPLFKKETWETFWEEIKRRGSLTFETQHQTRQGRTFPVEVTANYVEFGGKEYSFAFARDITDRKRAEDALRESEERLRSLVENASVGIYRTTPQGRILMANPTLVTMLGYTDFAALAERNLEEEGFGAGYSRKEFRERVERDGEISGLEAVWTKPDDSVIFIRESARAIRGEDGQILYYDGIVEDITQRKRAEDALRLTQFSVEHASDAIHWMDSRGRIVFVNDACCRSLGRSREELLSLSIPDIDPLFSPETWRTFWENIKQRGTMTIETQHQTKQGKVFLAEVTANYLEFGGKEYSFAFARDITERKRAEAALLESEERFRQISETIDEVFWMADPHISRMLYISPAYERVWGRPIASLYEDPKSFLEFIHADDRERMVADLEAQKSGQPFDHEYQIVRPDGAVRWIWGRGFPVRDEAGKVVRYVGVAVDITESKSLEAQLHQAAKMEAVGRLAGGVAHDFNNLLTIINGYSELLREKLGADEKPGIYLKEILDAGQRAATLTRQLLAFSRRQVLTPQVLDLNAVIPNLEKMLRRLIGEDIKLHTLLEPSLNRVKADPGQIEQVIMNVAVNARDAMPQGGDLTIETSNVELDEAYARSHPSVKPGPHVMLSIGDTGMGMTPETMARIFEPFFTTKAMGQGTGLGLATVYGIVKQSGGSIWVYSELGQGTVFKLYFPMVMESAAPVEQAKSDTGSHVGTETIMVVEDEEGVRSLIHMALTSSGYKVLETDGAKSALATCAKYDGPIHLLLTDVVMPQMSGPRVAKQIVALRPDIKVLYMSGYTDDAVVRHGVLSPDMPFIQKPFSPSTLRKKIREVLGGE